MIVELRRDLAGLAQMLNAANPAALRVAVDAVEAAFVAAAGSADLHRRHGAALAPEIRARNEARWKRARALFAEAKATLTDAVGRGGAALTGDGPAVRAGSRRAGSRSGRARPFRGCPASSSGGRGGSRPS